MINPRLILTTLVGVGITTVNAGPCKPHSISEAASSSTLGLPVSVPTSLLSSVTWTSTSIETSETEPATESETLPHTDSLSVSSTTEDATTTEGATTAEEATTTDFTSTVPEDTTTSAAASATTSAAADTLCGNQIFPGEALSAGYTSTDASTEADCWDSCNGDEECNTWWFRDDGDCQLYRESFDAISRPTNERSNLIGSRNCSPRDYTPCNDEIGFGYISETAADHIENVRFELDCAHLCMKDRQCEVWQYDSSVQTCNKFSGLFGDIFTSEGDGSRVMLAGSRSCSSDFFKPQLEPCNGRINTWNHGAISGYRYFTEIKTVPLCARACSIDPMCLSWGVFDAGMSSGGTDCSLSQYPYYDDESDICGSGSRNCGVP